MNKRLKQAGEDYISDQDVETALHILDEYCDIELSGQLVYFRHLPQTTHWEAMSTKDRMGAPRTSPSPTPMREVSGGDSRLDLFRDSIRYVHFPPMGSIGSIITATNASLLKRDNNASEFTVQEVKQFLEMMNIPFSDNLDEDEVLFPGFLEDILATEPAVCWTL
jgi:hypothetical protein